MPIVTLQRILTVVLFAAPLLLAREEGTTDFSGTWVLNRGESEWSTNGPAEDSGGRAARLSTMTITRAGSGELNVVFSGPEGPAGNTRELSLNPGAGPQTISTFTGDTTVETIWEDGKLIVKQMRVFETRRGDTVKVSERTEWELSNDGRKLIRRIQTKTARGTSYRKIVYDRQ